MAKNNSKSGVYAGSFDPITKGHLDIIFQAAKLLDTLYIVVGVNSAKTPLFTAEERIAMIRHEIAAITEPALKQAGIKCEIKVAKHPGLTAAFMKAHDAPFYIRGLRLGTEFDAEYPAIVISKREYPAFTPVFLCAADPALQVVSSSMARELQRFGGKSMDALVTPYVAQKLKARLPGP